jgi:Biotin-lipoyl like
MDRSQLVGYARPVDHTTAKQTGRSRWTLKRLLMAALVLAVLVAAGIYGHHHWTVSGFLVTTDDAYVNAHSILISPKISGYLSEVPVDDNQAVKGDELLARIDPRDNQTALDQARANVEAAQASIDTLNQHIADPPGGLSLRPVPLLSRVTSEKFRESTLIKVLGHAPPCSRYPMMRTSAGPAPTISYLIFTPFT